ncbi:hypothetical protein ABIE78_000952 [Sinorhizobium fredii]|uniref:Transmembrane protein n=1 Tax=Sinorhizobium fredii (strain USDA 257) TaxID=1185652 RepID=I3XB96_SINF2|nr:hypothetical protein [Sinorhizobium fredii]AFL53152.1 hypothetical protein USDA257_c46140 [Sinorhizobium fredii USDA 257]
MTNLYEMQTKQMFTDRGILGIWLVMCSPVTTGFLYWWLVHIIAANERAAEFGYRSALPGSALFVALLLIASSLAFIAGCILLLIGRSQETTVRRLARPKTGGQVRGAWASAHDAPPQSGFHGGRHPEGDAWRR